MEQVLPQSGQMELYRSRFQNTRQGRRHPDVGIVARPLFDDTFVLVCVAIPSLRRMFFLEAGGYDEDLSGSWGYSDFAFQTCVKHNFKVTLDHFDMKYGKGIWAWYDPGDASELGVERDFSQNKGIYDAKSSRGQWCGNKDAMARVSYHVASSMNWDAGV